MCMQQQNTPGKAEYRLSGKDMQQNVLHVAAPGRQLKSSSASCGHRKPLIMLAAHLQ